MKKSLDKDLVLDIARETSIGPAFIEKDWYSVELLSHLSTHQSAQGFQLVFSGGTSLTKGHELLKRFSEDLDFVVVVPTGKSSRAQRRAFREQVLSDLSADERFYVNLEKLQKGDESRFFKVQIEYDKNFEDESLRPHLQLEFTFSDPKLPIEKRAIQSFVSEFINEEPSVFISCLSPIEILADKLSALTWRVFVRDRAQEDDDPTVIRHLHDLAASKNMVEGDKEVCIKIALTTLANDQSKRGQGLLKNASIPEMLSRSLKMIKEDPVYRTEYTRYVEYFSYADEDERISFDTALDFYAGLVSLLTSLVCT